MLKKEHISQIEAYSPEWFQNRIGKFTSSKMVSLMSQKPLTEGAMSYIYQKVGEELTGQSNEREFEFDEDIDWGNKYEAEAIKKFQEKMNVEFLVTQRLIFDPKSRFASTPDAIWVHGESSCTTEYNVSTAEAKCPRTYPRFVELFRCQTPFDVARVEKKYYWQVIDQMDQCDSAVGYFFAYHPYFPEGSNLKIVQFRKIDMWDDFKLLKQRKKLAIETFSQVRDEMIGLNSTTLPPTLANNG